MPCFFNYQKQLELPFQTSALRRFLKITLKIRKTFPPTTPLHFSEAFEVPRNFSRKVSCVGVWGGQPQHLMHTKKKKGAYKSAFTDRLRFSAEPPNLTFEYNADKVNKPNKRCTKEKNNRNNDTYHVSGSNASEKTVNCPNDVKYRYAEDDLYDKRKIIQSFY